MVTSIQVLGPELYHWVELGCGMNETSIWAKAIGRVHLCTDTWFFFFFELGKKVIDMADSHILEGKNAAVLWMNKWSLNLWSSP